MSSPVKSTTPTASIISSRFNSSTADVILVSNDNVELHVHKINLQCGSTMFDALFSDVKPPASPSSSTGGTTRVAVDDPSHALELVLPYLYSARIEPIELTFPELWEAVKIMDKYEIHRGVEAVEAVFMTTLRAPPYGSLLEVISAFSFASHFGLTSLQKISVQALIDKECPYHETLTKLDEIKTHFADSSGHDRKLLDLIARRTSLLAAYHVKAGTKLASEISGSTSNQVFKLWQVCITHSSYNGYEEFKNRASLPGGSNSGPTERALHAYGKFLRTLPTDLS